MMAVQSCAEVKKTDEIRTRCIQEDSQFRVELRGLRRVRGISYFADRASGEQFDCDMRSVNRRATGVNCGSHTMGDRIEKHIRRQPGEGTHCLESREMVGGPSRKKKGPP
jgi:hypothetical protein